jgi:hypothetical protein
MAFDMKKLNPVNGPFNGNAKMFTYSSTDTLTTSGYCNKAYTKLAVGDVLIGNNQTSGAYALYKVTASSASGVTVAALS